MTRRLVHDEGGFSLIELLTTLVIGMIVLLAVFSLLEVSFTHYGTVDDRVDTVARGRQAMETLTQEVRSQACLGTGVPAVIKGTTDEFVFTADLGSNDGFAPQKRQFVYTPPSDGPDGTPVDQGGGTNGSITEFIYNGSGSPPNVQFDDVPSRTREIIGGISRVDAGTPVWRYFSFTSDPVRPDNPLTATPPAGLSTADAAHVVKIELAYRVHARHRSNERVSTNFDNYVYVRTADPTDPDHSPLCQ